MRQTIQKAISTPTIDSLPFPRSVEFPFETCARRQAGLARHRLYALTVFYTLYAILILVLAFTSTNPWITVAFFSAGCVIWSFVEYLFHRFLIHGRFDPLYWEQHLRSFDGKHFPGEFNDILPLFVVAPASYVFPGYSLPVLLAGIVQSYVAGEWLLYERHFSNPKFPLFRHTIPPSRATFFPQELK